LGQKDSGGKIEVLVERILSPHEALAHIRASHAPKPGSRLHLADAFSAWVVERRDDLYLLRFENDASILELLDRFGRLPLRTLQTRKTKLAIRPFTPVLPARLRRRQLGCISTTRCSISYASIIFGRPM
jgi:S-adenosylmethionine:tRNA-ribosyltransferase-isomerase (queuine synthetase)